MVITFCGHANFLESIEYENKLLLLLEKLVGNSNADFYLGGYGNFDKFAYNCCKKYKESHPNTKLIFVTPYFTLEYQKNHLENKKTLYDSIIYPEIENVPPKFAITFRNKYMVDKANFVIAFITHDWGGANNTFLYAKRKKKTIFNLAE